MGFAFPFPFGFFPSTEAEDGDPLDVLLLTDADLPMGCLVSCRVIGGIAIEDATGPSPHRNDRILAVPLLLHQDRPPFQLADIPSEQLKELESFFVAYQAADDKQVKVVARLDRSEAEAVVQKAAQD